MSTAIMFVLMFAFFAIGVPIGVSLILPCFVLLAMNKLTSPEVLAQTMFTGTASFTMIALPFFMICGNIMDIGGISKRLVHVANACVGSVTGSLGLVAILACMFFGAVSGSAVATVAAIGIIMIPEMVRNGYDKYYATGLCAVAGGLGIIVPPSYPMVIYGITSNVSIADLFIGGIVPSLVVGLCLMAVNYVYCRKRGIRGTTKFSLKACLKAFWDAKLALLRHSDLLAGAARGGDTDRREPAPLRHHHDGRVGSGLRHAASVRQHIRRPDHDGAVDGQDSQVGNSLRRGPMRRPLDNHVLAVDHRVARRGVTMTRNQRATYETGGIHGR